MSYRLDGGLLFAAGLVLLCGCAAKQVVPVRMAQPGDEGLSCGELNQQIAANRAAAEKYIRKDKQVENGNAAKTVGTALPALGILMAASLDLSNEEQVKARALVDRDERLTNLAKRRGCIE